MKELAKTNRLIIAVALFIIILLAGFVTMQKPEFTYSLSQEEILDVIQTEKQEISPELALKIIESKDETYRFIDLRNPYEYNINHIEGAVNIPANLLLNKSNLELLETEKIQKVLYDNDQLQANGPWLVLKQLGYQNIHVLKGGFEYYKHLASGIPIDSLPDLDPEIPKYDYAAVLEEAIQKQIKEEEAARAKPVVAPKTVRKKITPKPKPVIQAPVEEEEEEGC